MGRILRLYVIREVALPSMLALLTITFIMLVGKLYKLVEILLQPSVKAGQVLIVLGSLVPALLTMAIPMALLIGCLIGVGRMVLDREVLAIRASGVNLFAIFFPFLTLALFVSLGIMSLNGSVIPQLMLSGIRQLTKISIAIYNSLEPGIIHDELGTELGAAGNTLYFAERDPVTHQMKRVLLTTRQEIKLKDEKSDPEAAKSGQTGLPAPATGLASGIAASTATQSQLDPASTVSQSGPLAPVVGKNKEKEQKDQAKVGKHGQIAPAKIKGKPGKKGSEESLEQLQAENPELTRRVMQLTTIFAESGNIESRITDTDDNEPNGKRDQIILTLHNGTIHRLAPDPTQHEYSTTRFSGVEKRMFLPTLDKKPDATMTNRELHDLISKNLEAIKALTDKVKIKRTIDKVIAPARSELLERQVMAWASLVFALIGIPLAIWVKPTGKSWGILLAIGLMLVYYVLMKMGLAMVQADMPLGLVATYLPNLLFLALGAWLWRQTVRS